MARFEFEFTSRLSGPPEAVWRWITSLEGISAEMRPWMRMSAPGGIGSILDLEVVPGQRLFRSTLYLLGFLPIDRSDLTLVEIEPGRGFVEQSAMLSMRLWRHERRILDDPGDPAGVLLVDRLTFEPKLGGPLVGWFTRRFFEHRHRVLRARLGSGS